MQKQDNTRQLNHRAEGDIRLIRSMMQRTLRFVPMPGWGLMLIGVIGLAGSWFTAGRSEAAWLTAWLIAAGLATLVAVTSSSWQYRKIGRTLFTGNGRRFWFALAPGFLSALILTAVLVRLEQWELLPGTWLMLYGVSLSAAGEQAIPPVSWMGWSFLLLGGGALFLNRPDFFMAAGFGGLHLVFGLLILRSDNVGQES